MLLFTRESARWRRWVLLASIPLVASYAWYAGTGFPHGGSPMGIFYGILGLLLFAVLLFFGIRKRWHKCTFGNLETWCQSHIYLGLLVILVILFHSGFRFEDKVAVAAFAVMGAVVLTGIVGAILYTVVPWLLTGVEGNLSPEEVSRQLNQLAKAMARQASGKSPAFQQVYESLLRESLPGPLAGWWLLLRRPGRGRGEEREAAWERFLKEVPPAEQRDLKQLLILSRQYKELHQSLTARGRYMNLLNLWLYFHVPLSVALVVLVAAHLVGALYYSGLLDWF